MKPLWKIRALAILLIVLFGLGTAGSVFLAFKQGTSALLLFSTAINIGFVIAAIGLLKIRRWAWWLTMALCAISLIQFLWQLFTTLTPETATKPNEMAAYVVAGFYIAIAFVLTSDSVRKTFREAQAVQN
jgi:bacteriorhodopsin